MEEIEAILETGAAAAVEVAASALAERGGQTPPCANCGKPLLGPFCAVCGQPANTHRRSVHHLFSEFVKDIVSFDSRILRTGRALLFKPGELPRAFRDGRTMPYVPAVRLYLFVSLLFFLFLSITGIAFIQLKLHVTTEQFRHDAAGQVYRVRDGKSTLVPGLKSDAKGNITVADPAAGNIKIPTLKADGKDINNTVTTVPVFFARIGSVNAVVPADIKRTLDELKNEYDANADKTGGVVRNVYRTLVRLETDPAALNEPLTAWIPRVLFVLLPLFALLLALFYRGLRKSYLFVDHLVFSLTIHSFAFVVLIGAAILAQVMGGSLVALLAWAVLSLYFLLSLKFFYGQNWFMTVVKFAGISIVYAVFFLAPAIGVAIAASVVGG